METFDIDGVKNTYLYKNPNSKAKYGMAFSFWYSNVNDLIFVCELIDRSWINREYVDVAIASYADLTPEQDDRLRKVVNYIIKVDEDKGKQNGTTAHCNAALYPMTMNENIDYIAHADSDVPFINQTFFFGFAQMLRDSGKLLMSSQDTVLYDLDNLSTYIYGGHDINQLTQFGSVFMYDRKQALESGYFPFPLEGHFERDRYTHFVRCGFNIARDAIIMKRAPVDFDVPTSFLYSFDFCLGVVHQTNMIEYPENEDRKTRWLKLVHEPGWENLTLGYKTNYNPKSPRKNYGRL